MFNKIIKAKKLINQHIINTPSGLSHALSELTGRSIFVKYENKQHTGSFKFRGSLNKLLSLTEVQKKRCNSYVSWKSCSGHFTWL